MREHDPNYVVIPGRRGPGIAAVILVSSLTAALVSAATVVALTRSGALPSLAAMGGRSGASLGDGMRVPDVVGMAAENADELLSARKLRFVVKGRQTHPSAEAGNVIEQSPLAQSRVEAGAEVAVVLSTGPDRLKVPDVIGQSLEDAQRALDAAGLRAGSVMEVDAGEPGKVTAVSPQPGTDIERGASVSLAVARPKVVVPRLRGEHVRNARERIEKAGLVVGDVRETYDSRQRGNRVLSQEPGAGTAVPLGSKVDFVVNQGD
jgi:eukaryotic-like serine/threonine-protein kinase